MRASNPFLWFLAVFQPFPLENSSPFFCSALPVKERIPLCSAACTYKPHVPWRDLRVHLPYHGEPAGTCEDLTLKTAHGHTKQMGAATIKEKRDFPL